MTVTPLRPAEPRLQAGRPGSVNQLRTDRWQPTRAGVLNVWRYYDEVFTFHHGRLLLRGPNGTGKSKALELLLPYLLDANLQPHRLSTFGGSERTMHWNLMGDRYDRTTRVGFVWLEFGRLDADGTPTYFTCGARLSATTHGTRVTAVYFTTGLRVGVPEGLHLVRDGSVPLTRAELEAAVEGAGAVHDAPAYRRRVRETLLRGLTEDQYGALINALLKLRTPKLSEHLDPEHLSNLLSEALPPLDQQDLAEIAEGFEKLDRQREDLGRLDQEVGAAEQLADKQRRYARRALRRAAAELVSATTRLDNLTRAARESRTAHERAVTESNATEQRLAAIERSIGEADHRISGLTDSDAYREGSQLAELRERAENAQRAADAAQAGADQRAHEARTDAETASASRQAADTARGAADRAHADARQLAVQAGVGLLFEPLAASPTERARPELRGVVNARERQIGEVRDALDAHGQAVAERERTERQVAARADELDRRLSELEQCTVEREAAMATLCDAVAGWARQVRLLPLADRAEELAALAADELALLDLINQAAVDVRDGLARHEQLLSAEKAQREDELRRHVDERDGLRRATELAFPPPPRRTADRGRISGAALWRLVDWRPGVTDVTQAAVEAALEAAGVLDAWLRPDGRVDLGVDGHDTFLAAALASPAPGESLADLLVPEPEGSVPVEVVNRVLAGIAYGPSAPEHVAAVGVDGSWRLGPAHGTWIKPEATYLGATARERARQRRLAELTAQIELLDAAIADLAAGLAQVATQRETLVTELRARSRHDELRQAERRLDSASVRVGDQQARLAEAKRECAEAEAAAKDRLRTLSLIASRHALPTTRASLDELADLVRAFRNTAEAWLADRDRWQTATGRADDAEAAARRSRHIADEAAAAAFGAAENADGLAARLSAVEAAVDVSYRQVLDEIDVLKKRRMALIEDQRRLRPRHDKLLFTIGQLSNQREVDEAQREQAIGGRDQAAAKLTGLGRLGFDRDARIQAGLAGLATTTAALEAARQLAVELDRIGFEQRQIREAEADLSDTLHGVSQHLAGHVDLAMEPDELGEVQVVTATLDGQRLGVSELAERLRAERDQVRAQLTDDERRLFDRTLTGDTRRHVADRIRQADALVREVSAQLQHVRTVSALQVRLTWQVDADLGPLLRQARDLLLRDPATLTEPERDALHDFFRGRIDDVRATGSAAGWLQQLEEVLDYRRWHRFVVQMRVAGNEWVTVTRRQHGAKSGGEKAIVLHLPLFAAAAAHYRSAPEGPRIILLDEVFVGVDSTNRGQLMEVLAAFDLDLMLTSDTEWCTYPELDGIAIHQLLVDDEDDAVTTARFVWDGQQLQSTDLEASGLVSAAVGGPPADE